ncbi:helix-turn-helix domain-containing protein [Clostridium botulinum]|uniref:helix-turn-helix domain-containing protein n=1 Tax=Clostridium botulinum TaxID=1491 RepID=UPI00174907F7|nr:helix-turn-helix transcriptional regulator [Clostridium botulinum]
MTISKVLKYERLKRGMTQEEFSKLLGVDRASIAHYENGRIPSPSRLKEFSDKLNTDLAKALIEQE